MSCYLSHLSQSSRNILFGHSDSKAWLQRASGSAPDHKSRSHWFESHSGLVAVDCSLNNVCGHCSPSRTKKSSCQLQYMNIGGLSLSRNGSGVINLIMKNPKTSDQQHQHPVFFCFFFFSDAAFMEPVLLSRSREFYSAFSVFRKRHVDV